MDQSQLTQQQFGPRSEAYVRSAVHAAGADLDAIEAFARDARPKRALDLGCGGGHVAYRLAPWCGTVIAYDLLETMLKAVEAEARVRGLTNVRTERGPAETLPFPEATFDLVVTRFSAHHWRDVPAALRDVRRVLRPDGLAIVADAVAPSDPSADTYLQTIELLRDPSHVRDYSVAEWEAMLAAAGFDVLDTTLGGLRLEFASWVERMATPPHLLDAIRAVARTRPRSVVAALEIGEDASFTLPRALFVARGRR